ncbi:MAG: lyase [Verrucomicrobiales bacterium]|nr:lyase [Verrucomicrobiales bacterium]
MVKFFIFIVAATLLPAVLSSQESLPAPSAVSLQESSAAFVLSNRFVIARVSRSSGDLVSLRYQGLELLGSGSGHPYGYWSHAPGKKSITAVTIDPLKNNGERAEVSIKALYDGIPNEAAREAAHPAMWSCAMRSARVTLAFTPIRFSHTAPTIQQLRLARRILD